MFFQSRCRPRIVILLVLVFFIASPLVFGDTDKVEFRKQRVGVIFPGARKFVERRVLLSPEKITAIEAALGVKLRTVDIEPVFYIPINSKKKPMGLVLFADVEGPNGVINGAVGLNMKGKIVKVEVYKHNEIAAITSAEFLKQFIGMGVESPFKVGEDVKSVVGDEAASRAVTLLPKKTLVMSYALFRKRKPEPDVSKTLKSDIPAEELPETEDLKALMAVMIDDYFVVLDYFDGKVEKTKAVEASKRLAGFAKRISDFDPPKNANRKDEYLYLQGKFSEAVLEFARVLEKESVSEETRQQWDAIVELVNQAHLRFGEEEIDLDAY